MKPAKVTPKGAPKGNQNAVKPASERLDALVQIRVNKSVKRQWQASAAAAELTLSEWIVTRCRA